MRRRSIAPSSPAGRQAPTSSPADARATPSSSGSAPASFACSVSRRCTDANSPPTKTGAEAPRPQSSVITCGAARLAATPRSSAAPSRCAGNPTRSLASCRPVFRAAWPRTCGRRFVRVPTVRAKVRTTRSCSGSRTGVSWASASEEIGRLGADILRQRPASGGASLVVHDRAVTAGDHRNSSASRCCCSGHAVAVVLLVACVNLAGLMMARGAQTLARNRDASGARWHASGNRASVARRKRADRAPWHSDSGSH